MVQAPKRFGFFLASRWRSWLPPIMVVFIIVVALALFAPPEANRMFHYKIF
jgi:hypothetical protein